MEGRRNGTNSFLEVRIQIYKTTWEEAAPWAVRGLHGGDHQTCPGSPGGNLGSEKQLLRTGREMKLKVRST